MRAIRENPLRNRAEAQALLRALFAPLVPCFSEGRAQVKLGLDAAHFDRKAAWLEGFARPLWGLAPLHAGGGAFTDWKLFSDGIVSGVDPFHPEYWQPTADFNQRSVEIAALGFALALAPDTLWEPLTERTRAQLANWIKVIERVAMADNNWRFFPVMAELGLQKVGVAIDEASRDAHLKRLDDFFLEEGWSQDGPGGHIDHYNGFALHFYALIYARHEAERDPRRAQLYRERATAFARGFRHWFGRDGAVLAIGRSLTYRFAFAGFWGALAYADCEALPWGEIRGLWARQIRWWLDKPMLDALGRLSVGYAWPNYLMSEEYNSPGSPYWAFKAFLPLALPDTHPFWTTQEEEQAPLEKPFTVRGASMLIARERGDVIALPAAPVRMDMRNSQDKYGKFAYSSRFGLCVESDRWIGHGFVGDNILAVSVDGVEFRSRGAIEETRIGEGWIETRWSPLAGVSVTTLQGFIDGWEWRCHEIENSAALTAFETGHAVPARVGSRGQRGSAPQKPGESGVVIQLDDGHRSAIVDLLADRSATAIDAAPNTNIMFPHAAVPALSGSLVAGRHLLLTAVRAAFGAPETEIWHAPSLADAANILKGADWSEKVALQERKSAAPLAILRLAAIA